MLSILKIHGLLIHGLQGSHLSHSGLLGLLLNSPGLHHHGVLNMLLRSSRKMHCGCLTTECGLLLGQSLRHLTTMSLRAQLVPVGPALRLGVTRLCSHSLESLLNISRAAMKLHAWGICPGWWLGP